MARYRAARAAAAGRRLAGEIDEVLQQPADLGAFLPGVVGDAGLGEQALHRQPLRHARGLVLLEEGRLADLGRWQLLRPATVLAVLFGADVAVAEQREQRPLIASFGQPYGGSASCRWRSAPWCPAPDGGEDLLAHGLVGGLAVWPTA